MSKIGIGLTAALFVAAVAAPATATKPSEPDVVGDGHKVTICHATSSSRIEHGWIEITVDIASSGGLDKVMGHKEHALGRPNNRGRTDVIPRFWYEGQPWGGFGDPAQLKGSFPNCVGAAETATLIVEKVVVCEECDTRPEQFSFSVNGGEPQEFLPSGQNVLTVPPGTYTVEEEPPDNWPAPSYDNCVDVSITGGQSETCIITNSLVGG